MIEQAIKVEYPFLYDLYFRILHADLQTSGLRHEVYSVEFIDWVKAGIAFNVRGVKDQRRKIDYFVGLYKLLVTNDIQGNEFDFQTAFKRFYEDLFLLYQDYLQSQLKSFGNGSNEGTPEPKNLILLPSFSTTPNLFNYFEKETIDVSVYACRDVKTFKQHMSTAYAVEGSPLFRCMSMLYDFSVNFPDNGILLEVI